MSRTPSPRPFRLSDALVLIVATAVGLALVKFADWYNDGLFGDIDGELLFGGSWPDRLAAWAGLSMLGCLLVVMMAYPWSLALLALRMRRPRPPFRRLWRQPGTVACLAVALTVLRAAVSLGGQAVIGLASGVPWPEIDFSDTIPAGSGELVLAAWLVLALGRLARPEPSWIDRSGRALGFLMIGVFLVGALLPGWINALTPKFRPPGLPSHPSSSSPADDLLDLPSPPPAFDEVIPDGPPPVGELMPDGLPPGVIPMPAPSEDAPPTPAPPHDPR